MCNCKAKMYADDANDTKVCEKCNDDPCTCEKEDGDDEEKEEDDKGDD